MIAVIFEVWPKPGCKQEYLDIAAEPRPAPKNIDGFISIERFESLHNPEKLLSLPFFRERPSSQHGVTSQRIATRRPPRAAGTDVEKPGTKELEADLMGRFGRKGGSYTALKSALSFQYVATRDLVLQLAAMGDYHRIKNVPDMDDRDAAALMGWP